MPDLWLPGAERRDQNGASMVTGDGDNTGVYCTHHITWSGLINGVIVRFDPVAKYLEDINYEPHLMIDPFGVHQTIQWFPAFEAARALRDVVTPYPDHRTNRYGKVHIQIEWHFSPGMHVGGKRYYSLAETPMVGLGQVMNWLRSLGVPDQWAVPGAPKWSGNVRAWPTRSGHMGHSKWPENTHTDPGPMGDIFAAGKDQDMPALDATDLENIEKRVRPAVWGAVYSGSDRDANQKLSGAVVNAEAAAKGTARLEQAAARLEQAAADDAARDALMLAALQAGGGDADTATVVAAVNAARDELKAAYAAQTATLQAELDQSQAEARDLRERLAAALAPAPAQPEG